jgi:hypothetical protein
MVFEGVKPSVTGTDALPGIRSLAEIRKVTSDMGTNNPPESTAADGSKSVDVVMNTSGLPAVNPPMVKPVIVMTIADAGMTAPAVVMTTEVALVVLHVPVSPATLLLPAATVGVMDGAKKPEGYVSVMVLPGSTGVFGIKLTATGTPIFPAFRSEDAIVKAFICGEDGSPSSRPKIRENIAKKLTMKPIFHFLSYTFPFAVAHFQCTTNNRRMGTQTPQIIIAATSPCVTLVRLLQAPFSTSGMGNNGEAHEQKSLVPLNATPLLGEVVHEGQGQE